MLNLLSNAVKFSEKKENREGQVQIECYVIQEDSKQSTIEVIVKDNGIGLSQEN